MYTNDHEMGGLFDFLGKAVGGATKVATSVVQGKQLVDATKAAWKGVPYPFPQAPGVQPQLIPYAPQIPSAPPASASLPNRALTKAEVADLQATLNSLGHNTGAVDGIVGPNTRAGITSFQRANGLPANGFVTMALYAAVKNAASGAGRNVSAPFPSQTPDISVPPPPPLREGTGAGLSIANLPSWAIPAAIGGVLLLVMSGKRR